MSGCNSMLCREELEEQETRDSGLLNRILEEGSELQCPLPVGLVCACARVSVLASPPAMLCSPGSAWSPDSMLKQVYYCWWLHCRGKRQSLAFSSSPTQPYLSVCLSVVFELFFFSV